MGSASELAPQEVGALDRRGELVRISVAATIAIYTPFLHSSRGYGLFVDGPMEGDFDVAATESDRLAIRFNFDPSSQRFRYHVFHGPGHAAILDHYTSSPAGRGCRRAGPTSTCAGATSMPRARPRCSTAWR